MKVVAVLDVMNEDMSDESFSQQADEIREIISRKARTHIDDTTEALSEHCDIQIQRANGTRKINIHEKCSINALAHHKAHQLNQAGNATCSALALTLAVEDKFNIRQIEDLQAKDYAAAIEFMVDWNGVN